MRKKKETEVYIFGGTLADGHWPLTSLIEKIPQNDVSTTDPYVRVSSYPVRLKSGVSDTDRITTIPSSDYSGIGFRCSGVILNDYQGASEYKMFYGVF